MLLYLLTFAVALSTTLLLTPVVRAGALKYGILDKPNKRKVHIDPVPRLGGFAIYAGFTLAIIFNFIISFRMPSPLNLLETLGIVIGSTIVFITGGIDDTFGMKPIVKLIFQILGAAIAIYFGIKIEFISNPFNGIFPLYHFVFPFTLLWIVGITNAVNFIDGLDGLASGVSAIASITLFIVALRMHQFDAAIVLIALMGATLGFLKFNFNPASIFLGDSGSLFLGFVLASCSIIGVLKSTLVISLLIPILILGIPLFDISSAVIRRVRARRNPFEADKEHLHHGLLKAGFSQREAVLSIYIACLFLSIGALGMTMVGLNQAFLILLVMSAAAVIAIYWIKESAGRLG